MHRCVRGGLGGRLCAPSSGRQLQPPCPPLPHFSPPNLCHGGASPSLVPCRAAALSPGRFPTAALGRKGPSLGCDEVTRRGPVLTKAEAPQPALLAAASLSSALA